MPFIARDASVVKERVEKGDKSDFEGLKLIASVLGFTSKKATDYAGPLFFFAIPNSSLALFEGKKEKKDEAWYFQASFNKHQSAYHRPALVERGKERRREHSITITSLCFVCF